MDDSKCKALKADLAAQPEPQIVSIERFFDGNDDLGSIGCNLMEHPGMDVFRSILVGLLKRPGVEAVYAQVAELDPGEDYWPFTDTVFVVGRISADELRADVAALQPDTVGDAVDFMVPRIISQRHDLPVLAIWWD
jgi:hypothetical protein